MVPSSFPRVNSSLTQPQPHLYLHLLAYRRWEEDVWDVLVTKSTSWLAARDINLDDVLSSEALQAILAE